MPTQRREGRDQFKLPPWLVGVVVPGAASVGDPALEAVVKRLVALPARQSLR